MSASSNSDPKFLEAANVMIEDDDFFYDDPESEQMAVQEETSRTKKIDGNADTMMQLQESNSRLKVHRQENQTNTQINLNH